MKEHLGKTFEQFTAELGIQPKKHFHSDDEPDFYSIFISGNEYQFAYGKLVAIEIFELDSAVNLSDALPPFQTGLEDSLNDWTQKKIAWTIFNKRPMGNYLVIQVQHNYFANYYFDEDIGRFRLGFLRVEADDDASC